jgi:hypothetical protein
MTHHSQEMQQRIQEAKETLLQHGLIECTQEASQRDGIAYLCAFVYPHDQWPVCYTCETIEDLLALAALARASAT